MTGWTRTLKLHNITPAVHPQRGEPLQLTDIPTAVLQRDNMDFALYRLLRLALDPSHSRWVPTV